MLAAFVFLLGSDIIINQLDGISLILSHKVEMFIFWGIFMAFAIKIDNSKKTSAVIIEIMYAVIFVN